MKGLLHRLAERAAGTAKVLRPNIAPRFGAAQPSWDDSADVDPVPTAASADAVPPRSAERHGDQGRAAPAPASFHQPTRQDHPEVPAGPDRLAAELAIRDARPTPPAPVDANLRTERVLPFSAQPLADLQAESTLFDTPPRVPAQPEPPRSQAAGPALLMPRARADEPVPRADVQREPPHPPARPQAPAVARDTTEARAGTQDVHIHIGRIDVTALQEAPTLRRKPAAAPAAMSLDAYLAQRQRG